MLRLLLLDDNDRQHLGVKPADAQENILIAGILAIRVYHNSYPPLLKSTSQKSKVWWGTFRERYF